MKGGPKSSLRPFLHRALQFIIGTCFCDINFSVDCSIYINHLPIEVTYL